MPKKLSTGGLGISLGNEYLAQIMFVTRRCCVPCFFVCVCWGRSCQVDFLQHIGLHNVLGQSCWQANCAGGTQPFKSLSQSFPTVKAALPFYYFHSYSNLADIPALPQKKPQGLHSRSQRREGVPRHQEGQVSTEAEMEEVYRQPVSEAAKFEKEPLVSTMLTWKLPRLLNIHQVPKVSKYVEASFHKLAFAN